MYENGELVEKPQPTGSSRKGTPKKELLCVLSGESLVWRIDPYLASKVASGEFFEEQFPDDTGRKLKELTKVFCISSPKEILEQRRKNRDKELYNPSEYLLRDEQEKPVLEKLRQTSIVIENREGLLDSTIDEIVRIVFG